MFRMVRSKVAKCETFPVLEEERLLQIKNAVFLMIFFFRLSKITCQYSIARERESEKSVCEYGRDDGGCGLLAGGKKDNSFVCNPGLGTP